MNNNIKVIVDAGHGGEDPGAVGNNVLEKDLNLRAAKYMYKRLQDASWTVLPISVWRQSESYSASTSTAVRPAWRPTTSSANVP